VGTKRQAQEAVARSRKCGLLREPPLVGGTLTNGRPCKKSIKRLKLLKAMNEMAHG